MAKKRTMMDPTLPFTEIEIGGATYKMCLDLGALAEAELQLRAKGVDADILLALPRMRLPEVLIVFAASLQRFQPEIAYADATKLVTRQNVFLIAEAIANAWEQAKPEAAGEASADPQ